MRQATSPADRKCRTGNPHHWSEGRMDRRRISEGAHAGRLREASLGKLILRTETAVVAALADPTYALSE